MEQAEGMISDSDEEAADTIVVKTEVADPAPLKKVVSRRSSSKK
jgi:hypothetical protein